LRKIVDDSPCPRPRQEAGAEEADALLKADGKTFTQFNAYFTSGPHQSQSWRALLD
jgi:hypothetical protein